MPTVATSPPTSSAAWRRDWEPIDAAYGARPAPLARAYVSASILGNSGASIGGKGVPGTRVRH